MRTLFCFLILASFSISSEAQSPQRSPGPPLEQQEFLYYKAVNLLGEHPTKWRIDLFYRLDEAFFVQVKNSTPTPGGTFIRRGEILIELFDSSGISVAREIRRVELPDEQMGSEFSPTRWYQDVASFTVTPGLYKFVIDIIDLESSRRVLKRLEELRALPFSSDIQLTSTPFFVQVADTSSQTLTALNLSDHILFGRKASLLIQLPHLEEDGPVSAEYSITTAVPYGEKPTVVFRDTLQMVPELEGYVTPPVMTGGVPLLHVRPTPSARGRSIILPFPAERLRLRDYTFTVTLTAGKHTRKTEFPFRTIWLDMPRSARNVDYAIESLRYITTGKELDSLRRGSFTEKRDKLEAFWDQKDTTPETAFNEMMDEYYRRVDHATRTYATLRQQDGARTDRGKIFILYGPPTHVDRVLSTATGYLETWTYENHGKRFIFADASKDGTYVLITSEQL